MLPRGIRNNNPLNIRRTGKDQWKGMVKPAVVGDKAVVVKPAVVGDKAVAAVVGDLKSPTSEVGDFKSPPTNRPEVGDFKSPPTNRSEVGDFKSPPTNRSEVGDFKSPPTNRPAVWDRAFCQFESMEWGWRAAFYLLTRTYYHKYRLYTIRGIVSKWAPPQDHNNTEAYIRNVCKRTGIGPDEPLGIPSQQPARWMMLGMAMAIQENGTDSLDYFAMLRGWELLKE